MTALKSEESMSNQYLTFTLRDEDFAIDIGKVREVLDMTTMTKIPQMPAYISGVINLRGNVVPVLDLGYRLGMKPVVPGVNTCVMIVETEIDGATVSMGAMSDSVQMVLDIQATDIEAVPRMGSNISTDFIAGMGRHDDKFLIILNIDKVLAQDGEDLSLLLDLDTALASEPATQAAEGAAA
ncbi:MAG: chemotaxis protein CheW [Desulfobulbaceae bacterium]|nr:chemotaxis protein CheW [Desulfobulbaceae bacterium]HIJ89506.1 chemotaxis protein CheW [Deltaproteobacteria bacterium]